MTTRQTNKAKGSFLAKLYRYADGGTYKRNRYDIFDTREPMPQHRYYPKIGGALVMKSGAAIAFFAGDNPVDGSAVKYIQHDAEWFVWGKDLRDALTKFSERMNRPKHPFTGVFRSPSGDDWVNVSYFIIEAFVHTASPWDEYKDLTFTEWKEYYELKVSQGWKLEVQSGQFE